MCMSESEKGKQTFVIFSLTELNAYYCCIIVHCLTFLYLHKEKVRKMNKTLKQNNKTLPLAWTFYGEQNVNKLFYK